MLTKKLYYSSQNKAAMAKEIARAEKVFSGNAEAQVINFTSETPENFSEIPVEIRKTVFQLVYGDNKMSQKFRETRVYPGIFKRDDEDDPATQVWIGAEELGLKSIAGKEGVVLSFSTMAWWDGELSNGLPFRFLGMKATNTIPMPTPFYEGCRHSDPIVMSYSTAELESDINEFEDDVEREPSEEELEALADAWAMAHDNMCYA